MEVGLAKVMFHLDSPGGMARHVWRPETLSSGPTPSPATPPCGPMGSERAGGQVRSAGSPHDTEMKLKEQNLGKVVADLQL